jgi:hypothetical protein
MKYRFGMHFHNILFKKFIELGGYVSAAAIYMLHPSNYNRISTTLAN